MKTYTVGEGYAVPPKISKLSIKPRLTVPIPTIQINIEYYNYYLRNMAIY
jgi:hypothetical protein